MTIHDDMDAHNWDRALQSINRANSNEWEERDSNGNTVIFKFLRYAPPEYMPYLNSQRMPWDRLHQILQIENYNDDNVWNTDDALRNLGRAGSHVNDTPTPIEEEYEEDYEEEQKGDDSDHDNGHTQTRNIPRGNRYSGR